MKMRRILHEKSREMHEKSREMREKSRGVFRRVSLIFLVLTVTVTMLCGCLPTGYQTAGEPAVTAGEPAVTAGESAINVGESEKNEQTDSTEKSEQEEQAEQSEQTDRAKQTEQVEQADSEAAIDPEAYYYDLESVVLYLDAYGELPLNYITKAEAKKRGWEGGSVEEYIPDAAIGGDFYGNYEKKLPELNGGKYTECDLDTHGYKNRGSRRLIFSDEGRYFYTRDHYETFKEVIIVDGKTQLVDF